ncbi:DUF4913 domain-containing protein [Amycolatopsis sp. NPDC004368]
MSNTDEEMDTVGSLPDDDADKSANDILEEEKARDGSAKLFYGNVNEFVTERLVYLYARPLSQSGSVWCPEWYRHAEALSRLDSIWRAWENLRLDPGLGMSAWWLHHADPNMRVLLDPVTGPFASCVDGHHHVEPLPVMTPPEGLFYDQRTEGDPLGGHPLSLD